MMKKRVVWAIVIASTCSALLYAPPATKPVAAGHDKTVAEKKVTATEVPPVPPAPAPVVEAKKEVLDLELVPPECVPSHLNTTDVDAQGNWMIKRAFWEQAERVYEKIMKANTSLYEQQTQFVKIRNESEKISDAAFRTLGFEQGQLKELIDQLSESLTKQREEKGALDEAGRALAQQLTEQQHELEELTARLQAIAGIDEALDNVMAVLAQQLGSCREYERQAWDHFKNIGRELNDKKARILFYEMEGFLKNVEQTRDYVTKTLLSYMNDSTDHMKKLLDDLKTSIDRLKSKGLDVGKEFAKRRDKEALEQQHKAQQDLEKAREQAAACQRELQKTWWGRTKIMLADTQHAIGGWFLTGWHWVKQLFGFK